MKKLITLLLATVLTLSLAACGGGSDTSSGGESSQITVDESTITGTWEGVFESEDKDDTITQTLELYKGGTGKLTSVHSNGESDNNFSGTWELKDDVLNFSYLSTTIGYEIKTSDNQISLTNLERTYITLNKIN